MDCFKCSIAMALMMLSGCSSNIDTVSSYNEKLFVLEKKLDECKSLEGKSIVGSKITGVSEEAIRAGLTYFYIKNSLECSEKEEKDLDSIVDDLISDPSVSEYIRINARHLKESMYSQSNMLIEHEEEFNSLSDHERKLLNQISISNRPFSPSAALEYYVDK